MAREYTSVRGLPGIVRYVCTVMAMALRTVMRDRRLFITMNVMMVIQNAMYLLVWVVFFGNFSSLRGWGIEEVLTLFGVAAFAYGLAFSICGGVQDMARIILDGDLDTYLATPRHPLLGILFRESRISGLGDMATGVLLWVFVAGHGVVEVVALVFMAVCGAGIFLALTIMAHSLPLYLRVGSVVPERLLESFVLLASYPTHGFGFAAKVILLTVVPAGFINLVPVEAVRTGNPALVLAVAGASVGYLAISVLVFERGLRNYTSGNRMIGVR